MGYRRLRWGLGLLEVMIALFILSIAILIAFSMFPGSSRALDESRNYAFAGHIARQQVELIAATPFSSLPTPGAAGTTLASGTATLAAATPDTPTPGVNPSGDSALILGKANSQKFIYTTTLKNTNTNTTSMSSASGCYDITSTVTWTEQQAKAGSTLTHSVTMKTTVAQ